MKVIVYGLSMILGDKIAIYDHHSLYYPTPYENNTVPWSKDTNPYFAITSTYTIYMRIGSQYYEIVECMFTYADLVKVIRDWNRKSYGFIPEFREGNFRQIIYKKVDIRKDINISAPELLRPFLYNRNKIDDMDLPDAKYPLSIYEMESMLEEDVYVKVVGCQIHIPPDGEKHIIIHDDGSKYTLLRYL